MEARIKFRPIKPHSPHLNGKVERAQRTVLDEFYETVDIKRPDLEEELFDFQHYYNWFRAHGAHNGKTPMDRYSEESQNTPFWDEVEANYGPARERLRVQDYQYDLKLRKLRGEGKSA